jgi:hypothetical protein
LRRSEQKWLRDPIYRDTVAPFNCRTAYYQSSCRFSNEVARFGVQSRAITALETGHKGFRLSLTGTAANYEVLLDGGGVKLGLVRSHQPRLLLAEGSANSESTWSRFAEVIKAQEGK